MSDGTLLGWLSDPDECRGLHFFARAQGWRFHPYSQLAARAFAIARLLDDRGARPGDRVIVALGSGPDFVAAFFGTLLAGATPAPLAAALPWRSPDESLQRIERAVVALAPAVILTDAQTGGQLARNLPRGTPAPVVCLPSDAAKAADAVARTAVSRAPDRALVQFTSGTTGPPRAVAVCAAALEANIAAIRGWLKMTADDATATWLPVHHDMGLTGCLLAPVVNGSDIWMMPPEEFVRSPLEWLRCVGAHGARLAAAPPFGLAHVTRRVAAAALDGLSFAHWRALIVGGEPVRSDLLDRFAELLRPHGFAHGTLLPAYGLAEATLAVTGVPLGGRATTLLVDRRTLRVGYAAWPAGEHTPADETLDLVGCGTPLVDGGSVQVIDQCGHEVAAGIVGEIVVTGPTVAEPYSADVTAGPVGPVGSARRSVRTGDCGFVRDGQLYVLGRLGDSLKRHARTVFAEDLEERIARMSGGRVRPTVLLGTLAGVDTAVAVVASRPGPWAEEVVSQLRRCVDGLAVVVVAGPSGIVRRTSSGKPRRRLMWDAFALGALGGTVVAHEPGL